MNSVLALVVLFIAYSRTFRNLLFTILWRFFDLILKSTLRRFKFGDKGELCDVCSRIRLEPRTSLHSHSGEASLAPKGDVILGSLSEIKERTDCAICSLVSEMILKDRSLQEPGADTQKCILRPGAGTYREYSDPRHLYDIYYGLESPGCIRGHLTWRRRETDDQAYDNDSEDSKFQSINFSQVQDWLRVCQDKHQVTCDTTPDESGYRKAITLTLIDVKEYQLIEASSDCRYVTLSYVWGDKEVNGQELAQTTPQNLNERSQKDGLRNCFKILPMVIQDAWQVVSKLQERYLWVDALCIPQHDKENLKQEAQISQMDKVYNQSIFTIIALSGRHANEQLPGVRPRSRKCLTPLMTTKSWVFGVEPPSLDWVLGLTMYEKRAWTLQERLLSKRRLFISDWQMYFQCYQKVYQECFLEPRQILQDPNSFILTDGPSAAVNISYARLSAYTLLHVRHLQPWDMTTLQRHDQLVSALSSRDLTKAWGILRAFQGAVMYLQSLGSGPIIAGMPLRIIDHALLWAPCGKAKARNFEGKLSLPSWSWAAWDIPVRHIWNYYGVLNELMMYDPRTLASEIQAIFIEDGGILTQVDRNAHSYGPSRPLPAVVKPEEYGMRPLGALGHQVLHFHTYAVSAASFRYYEKRIKRSDSDGDWPLLFGIPNNLAINGFTNTYEGGFMTIGSNQFGESYAVYRQTNGKSSMATTPEDPVATWILDRQNRECGIILAYEDVKEIWTEGEDVSFILLSKSNKVPPPPEHYITRADGVGQVTRERVQQPSCVTFDSRGDRFLVQRASACAYDLAIVNVLIVKRHKKLYFTRIGIAQIFTSVWNSLRPRPEYVRLA